jgi:hypothetical protein
VDVVEDALLTQEAAESTKSHLAHLLAAILDRPALLKLVQSGLRLLDEHTAGGVAYPADLQWKMALESVNCSDAQIAKIYTCSPSLLVYIRMRVIAAITATHIEDTPFELNEYERKCQSRIEQLYQKGFYWEAKYLYPDESLPRSVRDFLESYAHNYGLRDLFQSLDIQIDAETLARYNLVTSRFLNPAVTNWRGFYELFRRYLFAYIRANTYIQLVIKENIEQLSELKLPFTHPGYQTHIKVIGFAKEGNLTHYLLHLARRIDGGEKPFNMNYRYVALAGYIYNLMLHLDSPYYEERQLELLTKSSRQTLREIRETIVNKLQGEI